jgi:hypothetical protein
MHHDIKVGTVSWISGKVNPMLTAAQAAVLSPDWVPKTYLGLVGTSNSAPPASLSDFKAFQAKKDFRALTYCHLSFDADPVTHAISNFKVHDAVHDPGWTPPFKVRNWPSTALSFDTNIYSFAWHQGEASPLSVVNTQSRHKNTMLKALPPDETVLVNGLIKFRAGKHTDDIGVNSVKSPYHVPWVWCELLVTYFKGAIKLYGQGSVFPSHAWYLNGTQVKTVAELADASFPLKAACISQPSAANPLAPKICLPTNEIEVTSLKLYKVLATGASASGAQPPASGDASRSGQVATHPNTVSGGSLVSSP